MCASSISEKGLISVPAPTSVAAFVGYVIIRVKLDPALAPATAVDERHGWAKYELLFLYVLPLVAIFVVVIVDWAVRAWLTVDVTRAVAAAVPNSGRGGRTSSVSGCFTLPDFAVYMISSLPEIGGESPTPLRAIRAK